MSKNLSCANTTSLDDHLAKLPPDRMKMVLNRAKILSLSVELKDIRKGVGLKKRELADRMGVPKSVVSAIERGDDDISLVMLQRYVQAVNGVLSITIQSPTGLVEAHL